MNYSLSHQNYAFHEDCLAWEPGKLWITLSGLLVEFLSDEHENFASSLKDEDEDRLLTFSGTTYTKACNEPEQTFRFSAFGFFENRLHNGNERICQLLLNHWMSSSLTWSFRSCQVWIDFFLLVWLQKNYFSFHVLFNCNLDVSWELDLGRRLRTTFYKQRDLSRNGPRTEAKVVIY